MVTEAQANDLPLLRTIKTPADLKKLSIDELPLLAQEIRNAICHQVSKTGGHLAPNLGVVELTIAMHYVFDFATDRLLFDVGHQCYPHKLLTGRLDLMGKLRTSEGMSGFPEPNESPYDLFAVGHAGTAVSTAVGMARGDSLNGEEHRKVACLVGDSSIVNGLSMEGLNNAGTLKRQMLVVLNDNGMSIAKPQGAMASYFDRVRVNSMYGDLKKRAHEVLQRIPGGSTLEEAYHRLGEMAKAAVSHDHMFEQFGLVCLGPIDGHDLPTLVDMLNEVKDIDRPVLLHVKTIKGKGFSFTEGDATTFHSPKPFTVEGCRVEVKSSGRSFTSAYADAMIDIMKRDEKVTAVTAAMPDGTGLTKVMAEFPDRTFDTGICESHAMDMCAGMAKTGIKPYFAVYSTFAQRALDQIFQEVSLQGLAVRVCMDRAGYVGGDGAVHHGFMDISMFRLFPNAALLAPSDEPTLRAGLEFMRQYNEGASFIRYPRDNVSSTPFAGQDTPPTVAILALGTMVYIANNAIDELEQQGYSVELYDARFATPVDIELVQSLTEQGIKVITVEDHTLIGGFGSAVLEAASDRNLDTRLINRMGMPQRWVRPDSRNKQLADNGMDAKAIARRVREVLDDSNESVTSKPQQEAQA
jgi:1-deoxy-D-xylulose-5-phosphate synthase